MRFSPYSRSLVSYILERKLPMSAPPKCQAGIPASCRYHGFDSVAHTRVLKQKLEIATQIYKAYHGQTEAYKAFATLREAQIEYYSTTQGLEEIEIVLSKTDLTSRQKTEISAVHKTALETRITYEKSITADSAFLPIAPKPYKELPPAQLTGAESENDTYNLSMFRQAGKLSSIDYDPDKGLILFSTLKNAEEATLIGKAENVEEATRKATAWYNRNFNR